MEKISDHVWWMPPAKPDRPALGAVVGERWTLMLDAGSSRAHTRAFLDGLPTRPSAVVYTHSHWDHGVQGMKVGGRRKLTIPSAMGYGARGAGGVIPPHEPLVFVVDLLGVD